MNFGKTVTLAGGAGTWFNVLDTMINNGLSAPFFPIGQGNFTERNGNVFQVKFGHNSRTVAPVSATDGFPLTQASEPFLDVDAALAWLYCVGTCDLDIKFNNDY